VMLKNLERIGCMSLLYLDFKTIHEAITFSALIEGDYAVKLVEGPEPQNEGDLPFLMYDVDVKQDSTGKISLSQLHAGWELRRESEKNEIEVSSKILTELVDRFVKGSDKSPRIGVSLILQLNETVDALDVKMKVDLEKARAFICQCCLLVESITEKMGSGNAN